MTSKPWIPPHYDLLQAFKLPLMGAFTIGLYNSPAPQLCQDITIIRRNLYYSKSQASSNLMACKNLIKEVGDD